MSLPYPFPDWMPWWVPMVLLVPTLLYALAFLFMPFSVLGVKSRLEAIEARLYDLQQELRYLNQEPPAPRQEMDFEEVYAPVAPPGLAPHGRQEPQLRDQPPAPPAEPDYDYDTGPVERPAPPPHARPVRRPETVAPPPPPRVTRAEPRLDRRW